MEEPLYGNSISQISFDDLFYCKFYKIPDYQRGYSWEKNQRDDLLADIDEIRSLVASKGHAEFKHYMGTIVAFPAKDSVGGDVLDVVDGQQRLTTLVILIAAIVYKSEKISDGKKEYLKGKFLIDSNYKHRFASEQQSGVVSAVIEGRDQGRAVYTLKQDLNVSEAMKEFSTCVEGWDADGVIDEVTDAITQKLGFILFIPKHDSVVGRMFEVINNRGKPLSELEKIKNYLIYLSEQHRNAKLKNSVNNNWREILESIQLAGFKSSSEEDEFLKVCWLVYGSPKQKSNYVYDGFKALINSCQTTNEKIEKAVGFFQLLHEASGSYREFFTTKESVGITFSKVNKEIEKLSCHPSHLSILPLFIAITHSKVYLLDDDQKGVLLELLEKLNFRYYVSGVAKRNDSDHAELFRLAHNFYHGYDEAPSIPDASAMCAVSAGFEGMKTSLEDFILKNARMGTFLNHLKLSKEDFRTDFYKWQGLKYFLACFEVRKIDDRESKLLSNFLVKRSLEKSRDGYQLEHLWATKDRDIDNQIEKTIGTKAAPGYTSRVSFAKRSLGNFILLPPLTNQSLGNKSIEYKQEVLNSSNGEGASTFLKSCDSKETKDLLSKSKAVINRIKYYEEIIKGVEDCYMNFAREQWKISTE